MSASCLTVPRRGSEPRVLVYKDQCDLTPSVSVILTTPPQFTLSYTDLHPVPWMYQVCSCFGHFALSVPSSFKHVRARFK